MAPRANWKGYLKLSLVSCPIALYPASSSDQVSFRRINRETGNRVKQQNVDAETGETVETGQLAKGYEVSPGAHIMIEDDELDAVRLESTHTVEIDTFVPKQQIDQRYLDRPYYIAPTDAVGQEAFAVIREAIRETGMVALGRVVLARREYVIAIEPLDKGLVGTLLRYHREVRDADAYFEDLPDVKIPADMLKLATHIVETKKADFDPAKFVDRYEDALVELIREKQQGRAVAKPSAPKRTNVVNLMDALKRSVEAEGGKKPTAGRRPRAAVAASARRTPTKTARKAG